MVDRDSEPSTLTPISPSKVPDVPGNGRKWFAILVTLLLLTGVLYSVVLLVLSI